MVFSYGVENATMECDECAKLHYLVSVGEEVVICSCGAVITFQEEQNYFEYFTMSKSICKAGLETAWNDDKRNLC